MITSRLILESAWRRGYQSSFQRTMKRTFTVAVGPGSNPLKVLQVTSANRLSCEPESGFSNPGKHWTFNISINRGDSSLPPSLKTVNFQRVSEEGIDFVSKKGGTISVCSQNNTPVSISHVCGKFVHGESVEQWRSEGLLKTIPLTEELIKHIPDYSLVGLVASQRAEKESGNIIGSTSDGYKTMENRDRLHFIETVQGARAHLEKGDVSIDEINDSVEAFRFIPDRIEQMKGGPDKIIWDRWQWKRIHNDNDKNESELEWSKPIQLLPY